MRFEHHWQSLTPLRRLPQHTWTFQRPKMFSSEEICSTLTQPSPIFLTWDTLRMLLNYCYVSSFKVSGTHSPWCPRSLFSSWERCHVPAVPLPPPQLCRPAFALQGPASIVLAASSTLIVHVLKNHNSSTSRYKDIKLVILCVYKGTFYPSGRSTQKVKL